MNNFPFARICRSRSSRSAWLLSVLPVTALYFASVGAAAAPAADLSVAKTASAPSVTVGSTLTYTIQVANLGPETATGVTVTDPLPKGADYVSATTTQGTCALQGQKVTCAIGNLEAGAAAKVSSATVTLAVIPRESGSLVNTASVKAAQKDAVAANNQSTATTEVLATATCRGIPATVVGTPGSDDLVGTGGRDVVAALGGNDTISSFAGNDLICAGGGLDTVVAGSAADRVFGGAGIDRLLGRGGPDVLKGNGGSDVIKGNAGADRIRGGAGSDRCRGGGGANSIRGCER